MNVSQYQTKKAKGNRRFTKKEDDQLIELVKKYGESNWIIISCKMEHRNSRQCKDRWQQYLSPTTNRSPWTNEEEFLLMTLVAQYGKKWLHLSKFFYQRPPSQLRNKYKTLLNKYPPIQIQKRETTVPTCKTSSHDPFASQELEAAFNDIFDFNYELF